MSSEGGERQVAIPVTTSSLPFQFPLKGAICNGGVITEEREETMKISDLQNAVAFLRRLSVGQMEADLLIHTVEQLEKEIEKRRKHGRNQG
jgi:hypothetical protein